MKMLSMTKITTKFIIIHNHTKIRWVDSAPTSGVTQVTIQQILTPHIGCQKVTVEVMNDQLTSHLFSLPIPEIWLFKKLTLKIHRGHACGQRSRSYCWLSNQLIYFLFISHNSALPFLRYSYWKFDIIKLKFKIMAKVKTDSHIWSLLFNRYLHFIFHGNWIILSKDIAYWIFDHENSRSRPWPRSNLMVTFEA